MKYVKLNRRYIALPNTPRPFLLVKLYHKLPGGWELTLYTPTCYSPEPNNFTMGVTSYNR